jgi:hypothetical protein
VRITRTLLLVTTAACLDAPLATDETEQDATTAFANDKPAFDYFVGKGLTPFQAAGIVGNLDQESGVNPNSVQSGGPGRGIAQWSVGGRWDTSPGDNAAAFASQHGMALGALNTQLNFIWFELTTFSGYGLAQLRAANTISAAVTAFQDKFEICGQCDSTNRINFASQALSTLGAGQSDACSVRNDHQLWCDNTAGAAMRSTPHLNATVVNHLRTSFSFFECWGTGDLHAGGNTTWYKTIGDDNSNLGWIPAVDLSTTSAFDSNPSAHGLPHC